MAANNPIRSQKALGEALARLRYDRDVTQQELADTLGISRRYVYDLESGDRRSTPAVSSRSCATSAPTSRSSGTIERTPGEPAAGRAGTTRHMALWDPPGGPRPGDRPRHEGPEPEVPVGSGVPSLKHAYDVLIEGGGDPAPLLRLATFSYLIGNTDMHAKNISFLRMRDGRVALSPAYDVAMHLHHPRDNRRSSLDLNGRYVMNDIGLTDLVDEGIGWGMTRRRAQSLVLGTVHELASAMDLEDPADHPGVPREAWNVVRERLDDAVRSGGDYAPGPALVPAPDGKEPSSRRRGPRPPRR